MWQKENNTIVYCARFSLPSDFLSHGLFLSTNMEIVTIITLEHRGIYVGQGKSDIKDPSKRKKE